MIFNMDFGLDIFISGPFFYIYKRLMGKSAPDKILKKKRK